MVLVELGLVEQRHVAVLEVLDGVPVTEVAEGAGVSRQSVHRWLKRYAARGLAGLVDQSKAPGSCPHQMAPETEARIVAMRVEHPGWGPKTIGYWLGQEGLEPVPGRTSIYRCLVRHGLITPEARKRTKADYKRWERSRSMELWQMDIVGGVKLCGGSEAKVEVALTAPTRLLGSEVVRLTTDRRVKGLLRSVDADEALVAVTGGVKALGESGLSHGDALMFVGLDPWEGRDPWAPDEVPWTHKEASTSDLAGDAAGDASAGSDDDSPDMSLAELAEVPIVGAVGPDDEPGSLQ